MKKCLNEVLKYGGPFSARDLYPVGGLASVQNLCSFCLSILVLFALQYQLALFQIDSMRKDGRFVGVDGTIPEGQGIVMAHLNECHELLEMVSFVQNSTPYAHLVISSRSQWEMRKMMMTRNSRQTTTNDDLGRRLGGIR